MEIEETTNLGEAEAVNTEVEQEVEASEAIETELDEDGNPIEETAEDDSEEVEVDGVKHKIPKALKPALMMQADYTRKTQELAEDRKAVQAAREAVEQASAEEITARARIVATDEQLARFNQVDWDAWEAQDPFEAQKGWRQFQTLQNQRGNLAQNLHQLTGQRTLAAQQETAKRIEEGRAVLERDIPGWSPETGAKLLDFGVKQFGFDRAEIEEFTDPRMVKVLHAAFEGLQAKGKQQTAQKHVATQVTKPAAKVGATAAPKGGLDDRLSTDEWLKRRNDQVRKGR